MDDVVKCPWTVWFELHVEPEFSRLNIRFSPPARALCVAVVKGQIEDGLVPDAPALLTLLSNVCVPDVAKLYAVKYGNVDVNVNRAVRWLADLHDQWIRIRASYNSKSDVNDDAGIR